MKALTDERWQEIRGYKTDPFDLRQDLADVIKQHDHLAAQIKQLAGELKDRFGPLPKSAKRLMVLSQLRLLAATWQINSFFFFKMFI